MSEPQPDSFSGPDLDGLDPEKLLAAALRGDPATVPAYDWTPPEAGEVDGWFPDHVVDRLIGRGAMGAVYHAVNRKLDRAVAIKLLPAVLAAQPEMAARFEREARALARMDHPNIVGLHDFGRTASGHLYIVMEHVTGADLSRLIRSGELGLSQALDIIGQVCDALQYAHSRGLVHRDIKPGNILVDTAGRVRIADFGLTKLLDTPPAVSGRTLTGAVLGTPEYTAPEQLRGGTVDHRADIYSLGVMLYEMLTGDLPRGAWDPPSVRTAADARLDQVVTRAMQTLPDNRYQHASEVKSAVVEAGTPPAAASRAPAWRWAALAGLGGLAVTALALSGAANRFFQSAKPEETPFRMPQGESSSIPMVASGGLDAAAAASVEEVKVARILSSIQEALDTQEAEVERHRRAWMELMKEHGIVDLSILPGKSALPADSVGQLADLEAGIQKLEARLEQTSNLSGQALYAAIKDEDTTIKMFSEQLQRDTLELARMDASGFGKRHPRRIGVAKQIEEEEKILRSASENHRNGLKNTISNLRTQLAGRQVKVTPVAPEVMKKYEEARLRYTIVQETLNQMKASAVQLRMGALSLLSRDPGDGLQKSPEADPAPPQPADKKLQRGFKDLIGR